MLEETSQVKLTRIENLARNNLKAAAAQLSRLLIEKEPHNTDAWLWLARTTSQSDEATKALKKAEALRPNDPAVASLQATLAALPKSYDPTLTTTATNPYVAPPPQTTPPPVTYTPSLAKPIVNTVPTWSPSSLPAIVKPVNTRLRTIGLSIGLPLLIGGLLLAIVWTIMTLELMLDMGQTPNVVRGQITIMKSSSLTVSVPTRSDVTFAINKKFFDTIEPLVGDNRQEKLLVANSVVLTVTPGNRLLAIDVLAPNRGTAMNNTGRLGADITSDWVITGVGIVMAILGMLIVRRTVGRSKKAT